MENAHSESHPAGNLPASAFFALVSLALFSIFTTAVCAQDSGQPARAVRLSVADGAVQLANGADVIAEQAQVNTPILQGMTISTGDDGKAEVQFEDGSVARIAPNSSLTMTQLAGTGTSAEADINLDRGEGYFELQGNGQVGPIRIHFGDASLEGSGFTILRVQYDTPPGAVAVLSGNAHLERGNSVFLDMHAGESLTFNSNSASSYDLAETIPPDSWDAWNSDRDQELNAEMQSQTNATSDLAQGESSNPAWSSLDANGSWYNVPGQGYVWSPYEAANSSFDPYGYGNWVWMPGFGYTWVSSYNWGYLPFSCGAWNYYDSFGWGWAPGFGGCSPWWRTGFYAGPAIGFAPSWYRTVHRPDPPRWGPRWGHPIPMISVHRNDPGFGHSLPPRDRNTPVNIGGATVVGLRPFPGGRTTPRAGVVVHGTTGSTVGGGFNNRPVFVTPRNSYNPPSPNPGPVRPGGYQPQRPGGGFTPQPGRLGTPPIAIAPRVTPTPPTPAPAAPAPAPAPSTRPYSPPAPSGPRPSGGPTPGGGFHPSPGPGGGGGTMRPSPAPNPGGGGVHDGGPGPGGGGGNRGGGNRGGGSSIGGHR